MARGLYIIKQENITLPGHSDGTLILVRPPTTCALELVRAWCAQSSSVTSAQQRIAISKQVAAFPTTLTGVVPDLTSETDAASQIVGGTSGAAGTAGVLCTAEGAGAKTPIVPDVFNIVYGWSWHADPGEITLQPGSAHALLLDLKGAAPASLTGWTFGFEFKEIG